MPRLFFLLLLALAMASARGETPVIPEKQVSTFLESYCIDCHDAQTKKGNLDLTALADNPADAKTFATWVKIHDRVRAHEMPPKRKAQPESTALQEFLGELAAPLVAADRAREEKEGRATWRRLNRYEYENTLRDLLQAPWLQIKDKLPEDGESHRFNKMGEALDVSHVQMARYLTAADYALREVLGQSAERPETKTERHYAREQKSFLGKLRLGEFNRSTERAVFPILGTGPQPEILAEHSKVTVGAADPATRELEAFGVVASSYEPIELRFSEFKAPVAGRYKLRFNAFSFWAGPDKGPKWWHPDRTKVSPGRRSEPVTVYSETPPRLLRRLGAFDVSPEPSVHELEVELLAGETIHVDASRLFRSRPPDWHNPLATKEGCPGVAFRWMEAEGPLVDEWPSAGRRLLFGDLPIKAGANGPEVVSTNPEPDAARLLHGFVERAYRRPVKDEEIAPFAGVVRVALKSGASYTDALIAGYSAVLCSPAFVCLEEKPGRLDASALAARLAYFLWNSEPDPELRAHAANGTLHEPAKLRAQTERLLNDPRSERFVAAFLDYWLDLRKVGGAAPDSALYNDYYLDDELTESATQETQLFFTTLLKENLPSRNLVSSDFAIVNERLARHYGLFAPAEPAVVAEASGETEAPAEEPAPKPLVEGGGFKRVTLSADSVRGGLLTQASVLKVTANGTTTSPVVRGAWVMERILGEPPPKPPASVPAVEPDTRGATTIREQLAAHRTQESCNVCHAQIDPAGFALESFDVMGGWRDHYRALGEGEKVKGYGKNGQPFAFHQGPPVDPSGQLPDGRRFADVRDFKRLLLADERKLARNLAQQLIMFGTGAPVSFADRAQVELILDRARPGGYGVRELVSEIVQSDLFQSK